MLPSIMASPSPRERVSGKPGPGMRLTAMGMGGPFGITANTNRWASSGIWMPGASVMWSGNSPSFTASTWACDSAVPCSAAGAAVGARPRWRSCCSAYSMERSTMVWRVEPFSSSGNMARQRSRAVWKSSFCSAMKA
ncbi:hypothetical protein D3C72_2079040 [compost metagenome]